VKDERAYLLHAIDAIDAILSYTVDGSEALPTGKRPDLSVLNLCMSSASRNAIADRLRPLSG
jgi:hypothetical protein